MTRMAYVIVGEWDVPRVMMQPGAHRPPVGHRLPDVPGADWARWQWGSYKCWDCNVECYNPSWSDARNYCPECGTEQ